MIHYNVNTCDQICNELQIHFTKLCPNRCPFCVDAMNPGVKAESPKPDVMAIFQAVSQCKDKIESVCITGGEPMLFMNDVIQLINLLKRNTELKIYLVTSMPEECHKHKDLFFQIIDLCDGVSISPQHYNEEIGDKMRGHKSTFDRQALYAELPHKEKVTLNINIMRPFLCEKSEICKCVEHYNKLGFKDIKVAELFNKEEMYVSFEEVFGIKLKSPFAHGCKTPNFDITPWIPSFDGKFTLKRTCFLVNKKLHANLSDMFKSATRHFLSKGYYFGVVYEDGSVHPYFV